MQVSGFEVGKVSSVELDGLAGAGEVQGRQGHPPGRPHRSGRSRPRACWAPRSSRSLRAATASCRHRSRWSAPRRPTSCPTPSAIWPTTDQRTRHRPAVASRCDMLAQTFADTPPDLQVAVRGRGALLADPQQARRPTARAAVQRQQGHHGAGRAQRPGGRAGRQHQRAAGAAADPKRCAGPDLGQHLGAQSSSCQGFIAENREHTANPRWTSSTAC